MTIFIGRLTYEWRLLDSFGITLLIFSVLMFLFDLFNFEINKKRLKIFSYISYSLIGIPIIAILIDEELGKFMGGFFSIGLLIILGLGFSTSFYQIYLSDKEVNDKNKNIITEDRYTFLGFYCCLLVIFLMAATQ